MKRLRQGVEIHTCPLGFFENGDTVVVLGLTEVKKGDQSAKLPVVHIWRFRGDDEVCRLQILTDTLQGARMLGRVESGTSGFR